LLYMCLEVLNLEWSCVAGCFESRQPSGFKGDNVLKLTTDRQWWQKLTWPFVQFCSKYEVHIKNVCVIKAQSLNNHWMKTVKVIDYINY
jgi:hypothetical protein